MLTENARGVWVDDTDGDCCWGDDNNVNENEMHQPNLDEAIFTGVVYIYVHDDWQKLADIRTMREGVETLTYWRGRGYTVRMVEQIVQEREIFF